MDPTETKLVRNNFIAFVLHLVIGISFFVVMQTSESNLIGIETSTYTLEPVYLNVDSEVEQVGFDTQKQSSDLSLSSLILAFVLIF